MDVWIANVRMFTIARCAGNDPVILLVLCAGSGQGVVYTVVSSIVSYRKIGWGFPNVPFSCSTELCDHVRHYSADIHTIGKPRAATWQPAST